MKISDVFKAIVSFIKSIFLSGLFTIIPIAATIFFINYLYGFVSRILEPLHYVIPAFMQDIPGADFILVMVLIFGVGVLLKIFIVHHIISYFDTLIARIPFIRIVYSSAKILVNFFKIPVKKSAMTKRVVLIPYPKKGQYNIAFLLESAEDTYEKIIPDGSKSYPGQRYVSVFMPNPPVPTSGYFFIMPEDEVIPTDITFEEATKVLVSCGLITPESIKKMSRNGVDNN